MSTYIFNNRPPRLKDRKSLPAIFVCLGNQFLQVAVRQCFYFLKTFGHLNWWIAGTKYSDRLVTLLARPFIVDKWRRRRRCYSCSSQSQAD